MKLNCLKISNFKGISELELVFKGDKTTISGENATGKSTVCDAWYWLMTGRDSSLVDNPDVIPIGATEVNPTVEAELDISGRKTTVRKVQVFKSKDGKSSTTNSYFVNEVPMTERDFKGKLEELGVDTEKLLVLSHPDFLLKDTSKKNRDYIRNKILFPMAESKTDKELAKKAKLKELSELLDNYNLAEIEAMEKATLARIDKEIGKDNKVANARIDELMRGKSGLNARAVENKKNELDIQISKMKQKSSERVARVEEIKADILDLKFDMNALAQEIKDGAIKAQNDLETMLLEARSEALELERRKADIENKIKQCESKIRANADRAEEIEQQAEELNKRVFDDKSTVCPTCGQNFPAKKVAEMKKNFEKRTEEEHKKLCDAIEEISKDSAIQSEQYDGLKDELDGVIAELNEQNTAIADISDKIGEVVVPEPDAHEVYKGMKVKMKDLEEEIANILYVETEEKLKQDQIEETRKAYVEQLAICERDSKADERIAEIRDDIRQAEINRANAEKIIYQLAELNKVKNASLENSINKHFKLVKWKLFKVLKNGNYEDDCTPIIDDRELWKSTNKGREVLAKLDIVDGLSRFYEQSYPILLDNAESLSEVTESRIEIGNQLVMFKVSEDKGITQS